MLIASVIQQVARLKVVARVENQLITLDDAIDIRGFDSFAVGLDLDERVESREGLAGGLDFGFADSSRRVKDLSLQVGFLHQVKVHQTEGSNARRCEVISRRRAEPSGPDDENPALAQFELTLFSDFLQEQMPRIT